MRGELDNLRGESRQLGSVQLYPRPCQVLIKTDEKERVATAESSKAKEEQSLEEFAKIMCSEKVFLRLRFTGDLFTQICMEDLSP